MREARASISCTVPETLGTLRSFPGYERQLLGDSFVRAAEEGSEHCMPRRERGEIMLREEAGALLHLRRETNQGPFLQHLGRGDYPRTVPDTPVLAVVAARALAAEGLPYGR